MRILPVIRVPMIFWIPLLIWLSMVGVVLAVYWMFRLVILAFTGVIRTAAYWKDRHA